MKNLLTLITLFISIYAFGQQVNPNPWVQAPDADAKVTYTNPIIPGFYSDPSVCRVGDDYYLVTSTFEYFPGVPVFHSKDLVNWEQIGHAIHRLEQFPENLNTFAATIRHNKGTFYMITTNVAQGGNFYVTATNPAGPWSDPIFIDMPEIDPDLFFDDDGKAYVTTSTFELAELDVSTGKVGERKKIWNSTGGRYPEAPHIYKKDGFYYLMAAEGGTEEAHMVTMARSNNIWGPYIDNPANPIAAHARVPGMGKPIQGIGHADLVQAHDDSWWMVIHGYRSIAGYPPHHTLGRETNLVPVEWPRGGWPVVNGNGSVEVEMKATTLPLKPFLPKPTRTEFTESKLGFEWNYKAVPIQENYELNSSVGTLILKGTASKIGEAKPTYVARRLTDIAFSATTRLNFDPKSDNEEAGMILENNNSHFDLMIKRKGRKRYLVVRLQFGQTLYESAEVSLSNGPVDLRIESTNGSDFIFSYSQNGSDFKVIETADAKFLSTETVGWFTGVYVGLYTTGNGAASKVNAVYDWFEYEKK